MTRRIRSVSALLFFFLTLPACGGYLVATHGPYRGQVIDTESKAPLEGAVVLAVWYRETYLSPFHGPAEDFLAATEVLTDAQGKFEIPRATHFTLLPFGFVTEPDVIIYQAGYGFYPDYQVSPAPQTLNRLERSRIFLRDGAVVALRKLRTREEQEEKQPTRPPTVPLEKMPNFTRLINIDRVNRGLTPLPLPR